MQQCGRAQRLDARLVPAELGGDRAGELGDAALVTGRVGVAQLRHGGEGRDRDGKRAAQPLGEGDQPLFGAHLGGALVPLLQNEPAALKNGCAGSKRPRTTLPHIQESTGSPAASRTTSPAASRAQR